MKRTAVAALAFAAILMAQPKADTSVDLVTVACSVDNHGGTPVKNLKRVDFKLSDNGQPREIHGFWQDAELPLTVALVADVSGGQTGFVKNHGDAIEQFLKQAIGPRDRAMIVEIDKQTRLLAGLTGSPDALHAAMGKVGTTEGRRSPMLGPACQNATVPHTCGGTPLWHAIYYTADAIRSEKGRKAIIVLSDGVDTGSDVSLKDLVETAQTVGAVVYSIKYSSPARFLSAGAIVAGAVNRGMDRLDHETGGLAFGNPGRKTDEVFARIESDLQNLYVLGFNPPPAARDGKFHKLEVKMDRGDLVVRTRSSYWAPPVQ